MLKEKRQSWENIIRKAIGKEKVKRSTVIKRVTDKEVQAIKKKLKKTHENINTENTESKKD